MKIGIVAQNVDLSNPGFAAAATKLQEQVRILSERGHEVTLVTQNSQMVNLKFHPLARVFFSPHISPILKPINPVLRSYWTESFAERVFSKQAKNKELDVIIQRAQVFSFLGPKMYSKFHIPCIAECNGWWGDDLEAAYPWTRFIPKFKLMANQNVLNYLKKCQRIISVSKGIRDRLCSHGIPNQLIDIIDNGARALLPNDLVQSIVPKRKYALEGKPVIGYVCSFGPKHALNRILNTAKALVRNRQEVIFMIIGNGPRFNKFRAKISQSGLKKHFVLPGQVTQELYSFILLFDIALLIYNLWAESSGLSSVKLFEYMACARPILVDDFARTDTYRLISNNETGLFLEDDSAQTLADSIEYLLSNPKIRTLMGNNAQKFFKENYTWEENVNRVLRSIESIQ